MRSILFALALATAVSLTALLITSTLAVQGPTSAGRPDDFFHAAQVYNHGASAEDYLRAHELATLAASKGNTQALFLSAASLDRFLRAIGRPQVFGTQYNQQGNMATMEPFDRSMSDALRTAFGVPSLKEQEARLKDMNKRRD